MRSPTLFPYRCSSQRMSSKVRVVSLVILGLLVAAMIARSSDAAWLIMPLGVYLFVGFLQTPDKTKVKLSATRTLEQNRSGEQMDVSSTVLLKNESGFPVSLWMGELVDPETVITDGELAQHVSLHPDETAKLVYQFCASRGDFSWENINIRVSDPLDLVSFGLSLPASGDIQVRPLIHKFKPIGLRPRSTLHSPGSIPARLGGSGTDFYGVREYHPGDPLRSLDWRMTARYPFKFFTKEFEQEEIADIGLILDARQNMEMVVNGESLFEHSVNAAASLAEMFLHQGHRVSLLVFGKRLSIVFPGYGKIQLHRIMSCLSKANVEVDDRISTHLDFLPIRVFPSRSTIISISPLASGDKNLYQRLKANGYQAVLISPDPIHFGKPLFDNDRDTNLAVRTTHLERRLNLDAVAQLQIPVINWKVDQPLYPLVRNALTRSRGEGA